MTNKIQLTIEVLSEKLESELQKFAGACYETIRISYIHVGRIGAHGVLGFGAEA